MSRGMASPSWALTRTVLAWEWVLFVLFWVVLCHSQCVYQSAMRTAHSLIAQCRVTGKLFVRAFINPFLKHRGNNYSYSSLPYKEFWSTVQCAKKWRLICRCWEDTVSDHSVEVHEVHFKLCHLFVFVFCFFVFSVVFISLPPPPFCPPLSHIGVLCYVTRVCQGRGEGKGWGEGRREEGWSEGGREEGGGGVEPDHSCLVACSRV